MRPAGRDSGEGAPNAGRLHGSGRDARPPRSPPPPPGVEDGKMSNKSSQWEDTAFFIGTLLLTTGGGLMIQADTGTCHRSTPSWCGAPWGWCGGPC